MTISEKIQKINDLNAEIRNLEKFLSLCALHGRNYNEDQKKQHRISYIEVRANIWTGSQNPSYVELLKSDEAIDLITEEMVAIVDRLLKRKEEELKVLLAI